MKRKYTLFFPNNTGSFSEQAQSIFELTDDAKETIVVKRPRQLDDSTPLLNVVKFAKTFSSTGAAFILATLGVITQTFHNAFLAFELSSFTDFWLRLIQAIIAAFFLSGALVYFSIRSSNGVESAKKLVWWFAIFEIICNLYYWSNKLIILQWDANPQWASMLIAVPFSFMIPWTIKAYSSEIATDSIDDNSTEWEQWQLDLPNRLEHIMTEEVIYAIRQKIQIDNAIKYGDTIDFAINMSKPGGGTETRILKATIRKQNMTKE
jgi:hypothetical protein